MSRYYYFLLETKVQAKATTGTTRIEYVARPIDRTIERVRHYLAALAAIDAVEVS